MVLEVESTWMAASVCCSFQLDTNSFDCDKSFTLCIYSGFSSSADSQHILPLILGNPGCRFSGPVISIDSYILVTIVARPVCCLLVSSSQTDEDFQILQLQDFSCPSLVNYLGLAVDQEI